MSLASSPNDEPNPYASPEANLDPPPFRKDSQCYRRGQLVIIPEDAELPLRCVRCNKPAHLSLETWTVYWHPTWVYFTIFGAIILYFFVSPFYYRKAIIHYGRCPAHATRHAKGSAKIAALSLLSVLGLKSSATLAFGVAGLVIAALLAVRHYLQIRIVLIDDEKVIVKGCGEPFLASLPTEPEPAS